MKNQDVKNSKELFYQRKLANYLKNTRVCRGARSLDFANRLGYSKSKYSELESDKQPYKRFVGNIKYLQSLADLDDLTITEFVSMLEGKPNQNIINKSEISPKVLKIISILSKKSDLELDAFLMLFDDGDK